MSSVDSISTSSITSTSPSIGTSTATSTSTSSPPPIRPGFYLYLVDLQEEMCQAWRKYFTQYKQVQIVHGRFESLADYDCIVSPGNSFGLMDGGMDAALTKYFGPDLQKHVQQHIINTYDGEQSVGTCFLIGTGHATHPWLAHAPTMRVPYNICGTDNIYRAMKSILRAVYDHNNTHQHKIRSLVCTGLGTYFGQVPPLESARQMYVAYSSFLSPPSKLTWSFAGSRHHLVGYGGYDEFKQHQQQIEQSVRESERSRAEVADDMDQYRNQITPNE